MESITKYLSTHVVSDMREAIKKANGNEVFFAGRLNESNVVEEIKVVARGNEFSVPILSRYKREIEVVIHNHPSGKMEPSVDDLYIAKSLEEMNIISYIVNNDVDEIYVIYEPLGRNKIQQLNLDELSELLAPGGEIEKKLPHYEFRAQQLEMMKKICDAFNNNKIAVIEAGTGVGKTIAYLLPAIMWAVNNEERCVISTNTINLQEQLIKKDIPFLQSVIDVKFKAVLVKGRHNYICLRKVEEHERDAEFMIEIDEAEELRTLILWSKKTKDGSKSDLNFIPRLQVWEKLNAESDTCMRSKCQHYKICFVNKARREANEAQILIVNHHLLFSDLAVRVSGGDVAVLPAYHRLIFDEAHHIEDVATNYLGAGVTRWGIVRMLRRLYRGQEEKEIKGYLPLLKAKLRDLRNKKLAEIIRILDTEIIPQVGILENLMNEFMDAIYQILYRPEMNAFGEIKRRITRDLKANDMWEIVLNEKCSEFLYQIKVFSMRVVNVLEVLENLKIKMKVDLHTLIFDIKAQTERLRGVATIIDQVLFQDDEEHIRWLELKPRPTGNIVRLKISPLKIDEILKTMVYDKYDTVIMTSATLTVSGIRDWNEFDYFAQRVGLVLIDENRLVVLKLPAPFDYKKQMIIGIPLDIPAADETNFGEALYEVILKSIIISQGRAFVLFTSYGLLNLIHSKLSTVLLNLGIMTLKQGTENRHQLLEKFKNDKTSVLLATDSFWEGVDVQGDALESVIITKLPFQVPTEPVIEARIEAIEKKGGNAFMEYSVPQAVIKLKQGLGRLIRSKKDKGSILICDKRIIEKFYGSIFLDSLPETTIVSGPQSKVFNQIDDFFKYYVT